MRSLPGRLSPAFLILLTVPAFALKPHHTTSAHVSLRHASAHMHAATRVESHHLALASMPSDRATEIQTALIKQGYLTGEPSGTWDAQSVSAMQKLQADNGWQTKLTPDSRALIKLGLGPHDDGAPASEAPSLQSAPAMPATPVATQATLTPPKIS